MKRTSANGTDKNLTRRLWRSSPLLLLGGLLALTTIPTVNAATINASVGGPCTIVKAVEAAENDTTAGGVCTQGSGADIITVASGIHSPATSLGISTDVTVVGTPSGGGASTIDGQSLIRIFDVTASGRLQLAGLTLTNGAADFGAAIRNTGGTVTLDHVTLTTNVASSAGGAIRNDGGSLSINASTLSDNEATGLVGGAISNLNGGSVDIAFSTLSGNLANTNGGAIRMFGGTLTIANSSILDNDALGNGAGLSNDGGDLRIINSSIADNSATGDGGGIWTNSSNAGSLNSTTVAGNSSSTGGGGIFNTGADVQLQNAILGDNSAPSGPDCSGLFESLGYNNIEDTNPPCNITLLGSDLVGDPALGAFVTDGAGKAYYPLTVLSPALNTGDDLACTAQDQIGQNRVGVCDMGAVEFQEGVPSGMAVDFIKSKLTFFYTNIMGSDWVTMSGYLTFPPVPLYTQPFGEAVAMKITVGYPDPADPQNTLFATIYENDNIRDDTPAVWFNAKDRANGLNLFRLYTPQPTQVKFRIEVEDQYFRPILEPVLPPTGADYLTKLRSITQFGLEVKFQDGRQWSGTASLLLIDFNEKKYQIGKVN